MRVCFLGPRYYILLTLRSNCWMRFWLTFLRIMLGKWNLSTGRIKQLWTFSLCANNVYRWECMWPLCYGDRKYILRLVISCIPLDTNSRIRISLSSQPSISVLHRISRFVHLEKNRSMKLFFSLCANDCMLVLYQTPFCSSFYIPSGPSAWTSYSIAQRWETVRPHRAFEAQSWLIKRGWLSLGFVFSFLTVWYRGF